MFLNFRLLIQKKQYTLASKWATEPYYHKVMQCSFPAYLNSSTSCNLSLHMQVKNAKNTLSLNTLKLQAHQNVGQRMLKVSVTPTYWCTITLL